MLTLAKGLAKRHIDVSFVLPNARGLYLAEATESADIVDLGTTKVSRSIPFFVRYLRNERPDAVIAALEHANTAALVAKRLSRGSTRFVVTTHTMVSKRMGSKKAIRSNVLLSLMRILYPTADAIVAVSKAVAADLSLTIGIPEHLIRIVYNPVPIDEVVAMSMAPLDSAWFHPGEPPVVLSIGSLWPHKDHITLIRAIAIANRDRAVRLAILGEGPERPRLEHEIRQLGLHGSVVMPGFVRNPYSWLAKSSLFALPSRWEGLPTALVEALACGVSPVATDCPGGSAEVLDGGKYGVLTPVGNAPAMAEAIVRMLDRPFNAEELRKRAGDFSADKAIEAYSELILRLVG